MVEQKPPSNKVGPVHQNGSAIRSNEGTESNWHQPVYPDDISILPSILSIPPSPIRRFWPSHVVHAIKGLFVGLHLNLDPPHSENPEPPPPADAHQKEPSITDHEMITKLGVRICKLYDAWRAQRTEHRSQNTKHSSTSIPQSSNSLSFSLTHTLSGTQARRE